MCAALFHAGSFGAEVTTYTLHIASQPLDRALQELSLQTGTQIIFFSDLTNGQRSMALDGTYTIDAALRGLLAKSRLTFHRLNVKTIEIVPAR
jgi:outer membrane receptor for ferric coprogen and ferric-rhodotorulic acid